MRDGGSAIRLVVWFTILAIITSAPAAAQGTPSIPAMPTAPGGDEMTGPTRVIGEIAFPDGPPAGPPATIDVRGREGMMKLQPALTGVLWQWQGNVANDGAPILSPDHPENYTVTFQPDGSLAIQADCNRAMGAYTVTGSSIDLRIGGVTRRGCPPGSLMHRFLNDLDRAVTYDVHDGNLALALPEADGVMTLTLGVAAPETADAATPPAG